MAKLVALLLCLAVVELCYGLECYKCEPSDKNCENFDASVVQKIPCGNTVGTHKVSCLKKVLKNSQSGQVNVTRKCILTQQDGNIDGDCHAAPGWEKVSCVACDTDGCNSAPATAAAGVGAALTAALGAALLARVALPAH